MRNIVSRIFSALAILIVAISVGSCATARKDNVVGGHHEMLALGKQIQLATLPQKSIIEIPEAYPETEASKTILTANQTSGQDKCTFIFALDSTLNSIYSYNIRLKKWDNVNLPDNTPKVAFQDAAAIGSAHIAFISDTIDSVYFYHTITNTFISMGIPASDGAEPVIYDGKLYLINGVEGAFTLTELIIQKVRKGFTPVDSIVMILYFLAPQGPAEFQRVFILFTLFGFYTPFDSIILCAIKYGVECAETGFLSGSSTTLFR